MVRRIRAWLRAFPLQRRVAYLTTIAVALAVAVTSVAGYVTLRISLYRALDAELVETATSLAVVPVAQDIRTLGGLTERALRAGNVSVAAIRTDGEIFYVPDELDHLVLGPKELAVARLQSGYSARSGVTTGGEHPDALELACRVARKAGTVSAIGVYAERIEVHMGIVWIKALTLKTGHANVIGHVDRVLAMLDAGVLDPGPLVTHHMKLEDAAEAYAVYDRREALKIVMKP